MLRSQTPGTVAAARVKKPRQSNNLCPGTVAAVHGVRVLTRVRLEPFVQTGNGVVLQPGLIRPHEAAVFGIENEHHAHERGEHSAVDMARVVPEGLALSCQTLPHFERRQPLTQVALQVNLNQLQREQSERQIVLHRPSSPHPNRGLLLDQIRELAGRSRQRCFGNRHILSGTQVHHRQATRYIKPYRFRAIRKGK